MSDPASYNTGRWKCGGCDGMFPGSPPGTLKDPWLCENCKILGRPDKRSDAYQRDMIARKLIEQVWQ